MSKPGYKIEVERHCAAWGVRFWVEHQSFTIGPKNWETRAEAKWFAEQVEKAIDKLLGVEKLRGRGPIVKSKRDFPTVKTLRRKGYI